MGPGARVGIGSRFGNVAGESACPTLEGLRLFRENEPNWRDGGGRFRLGLFGLFFGAAFVLGAPQLG